MNAAALAGMLVAAIVGIGALLVLLRTARRLSALDRRGEDAGLLVLQGQLEALREQMHQNLEGGRLAIDRRLEETNRVVGDVRRGLGEVDRQVRFVSDTARDLRGLQELLRSPKVRGGVGEFLLAELLGQVLPAANFSLQYEFRTGERVDAVLRVGEGLVPVDAKFPLENFQRLRAAAGQRDEAAERAARRTFRADVRRHVDAIAKRYIRPGEGTYEFALMYLPAEAVYQELLEQQDDDGLDLFHFALERRVVPVSPQSFYAYLQVIVLGLRGFSIETRAREIMERLGSIRGRLERFNESFETALRHLGNAQRQLEESTRRLAALDAALADLSGAAPPAAAVDRAAGDEAASVRPSSP
jgi:DNA recombination protein RmuC